MLFTCLERKNINKNEFAGWPSPTLQKTIGVSSMSIYTDAISIALGVRPINEIYPEYVHDLDPPEDSYSSTLGELNPFYGMQHTSEAKAKMSKAAKGRIYSEEYKRKMSETLKKRNSENPRSQEWCNNLSEALTGYKKSKEHIANHRKSIIEGGKVAGENNPRYGAIVSKETREKMPKALKGKFAGDKNPMFGKSAVKGKKWYNNGEVSGRFAEGEQPKGYLKGRLTRN